MACNSLFAVATHLYRRDADGSLRFDGHRPGPDWHAHGYCSKQLWMLVDREVVRLLVFKRRWRLKGTNTTCHSRPPDDPVLIRCCTLILFLKLWAWLSANKGLHRCQEMLPSLEDCGSRRSVQRWLAQATAKAMQIQQAIRLAIVERCEPRPMERLFPGGLSPPEGLRTRRWKDYTPIVHLWRALALALKGSVVLSTSLCILLAEARGRFGGPADNLVI